MQVREREAGESEFKGSRELCFCGKLADGEGSEPRVCRCNTMLILRFVCWD